MSKFEKFGDLEKGTVFLSGGKLWKKIKTIDVQGELLNAISTEDQVEFSMYLFDELRLVDIEPPEREEVVIPFPINTQASKGAR